MPVKPLTVVTKVGRQKLRADGLGSHDDIRKRLAEGELVWEHEDCVTLADAERYASEIATDLRLKYNELLRINSEELFERVSKLESVPQNHGAFYLETQADLALKERINKIEEALRKMGVVIP